MVQSDPVAVRGTSRAMEHEKVECTFPPFRAFLRIERREKLRPNLAIIVGVIPGADDRFHGLQVRS